MPYMELRNYSHSTREVAIAQRDKIMKLVKVHVTRGGSIDGSYEFKYVVSDHELDRCEFDFMLVIDMGWTLAREQNLYQIGLSIARGLARILGTESVAVRPRLQRNAAFVPFKQPA